MFHFPNTGENLGRLNFLSRFLKRVLIYKTCCNLGPELSHDKRNVTVSRKTTSNFACAVYSVTFAFLVLTEYCTAWKVSKNGFLWSVFS